MAQVNQPQRKKDPLEAILQGVQLAGGILGIKKNIEESDLTALQKQKVEGDIEYTEGERSKAETGQLIPIKELEIRDRYMEVPEGTKESTRMISSTTGEPIFLVPKPEKMTEYQKASLGFDQLKNTAKIAADQKLEEIKATKEDKYKADEINKQFIDDKRTASYIGGFESSQELQSLLSKKQSVIDQIALRKVFRLSGDVGAVRAEDLTQLGSSPAWVDRGSALINKVLSGQTISDPERIALNDFAKDMELNSQNKLNKYAESFAKRITNTTTLDLDKAMSVLSPQSLLIPFKGRQENISKTKTPGFGEAGAGVEKDIDNIYNSVLGQ